MIFIEELSYSFHLGNDKNKTKKARQVARNSKTGTTAFSNNAIQNYQQLSKANNHNLRKYDNELELINTIYGTNNLVEDVKKLYLKEFEKARLKYNEKQTRDDRKINDYFTHISNNSKNDLACEIIIELGDKNYWEDKDDKFKNKMVEVYKEQVNDFTKVIPEFKVANATIHFDESSPHLHVIGVPVKTGGKNGMEVQVGKAAIFTKESLVKIQDEMREYCINSFNRIYQIDKSLKAKEKGRNKDINVKDMTNYSELKKQANISKERLEQANLIAKKVDDKSDKIDKLITDLKPALINKNNYTISKENIDEITDYIQEVKDTSSSIRNVNDLTILMDNLEKDLKEHSNEVKNLKAKISTRDKTIDNLNKKIEDLDWEIETRDEEIEDLENQVSFFKKQYNFWKDKFNKLLEFLQDKFFSSNKNYENVINDLYQEDILDGNDIEFIENGYSNTNEKDDFER